MRGLFTDPMTKAESIAYLRRLALKEKLSEEFLPAPSLGAEESLFELEELEKKLPEPLTTGKPSV